MLTSIQNAELRKNDESLSAQPILKEGPQAYYSIYIDFIMYIYLYI